MKKFLLLLPLLTSFLFIHAEPLETLEQAIRDSDATKVRSILKQTILSDFDQTCLLDLSQQMILFRKSQLDCYCVGFPMRIKHPKVPSVLTKENGIGFCLLAIPFGIVGSNINNTHLSKLENLTISGGFLAGAVGLFLLGRNLFEFAYKKFRLEDFLREDFDNALIIRQLLLKHKNPTPQIL